MNTQNVPTWAKEAVAQGWTFECTDAYFPYIWRKFAGGVVSICDDGSGSAETGDTVYEGTDLVEWATDLPTTFKLANEYAEANGGWA